MAEAVDGIQAVLQAGAGLVDVPPIGTVLEACALGNAPVQLFQSIGSGFGIARERQKNRRNHDLEQVVRSAFERAIDELMLRNVDSERQRAPWRDLRRIGVDWLTPESPDFPSDFLDTILFEEPGASNWTI
ncbi:MAG: hypothetical protein AB7V46_15220, partial [Thermomicrobiales bacterium]